MTHHATTNHRPVTITSESVSEGHPDKVCDYIADSILDAYLAEDPHSRVACEVLCKCNLVVVAGEVSSLARIDYERVVREAIGQIGYTNPAESFSAESVQILLAMTRQSAEIGRAVDGADAGSQRIRVPAIRESCSATRLTRQPNSCPFQSCWPTR